MGIENKKGELKSETEVIKQVYKEFYQELFSNPKEENQEKIAKEKIDQMKRVAQKQEPLKISEEQIGMVINRLKRRKARNEEVWKNESLKEGGREMRKSIVILFQDLLNEMYVPKQWEEMKIKSIHKNKGKRTQMKKQKRHISDKCPGKSI